MTMFKRIILGAAALAVFNAGSVQAGPYSDELAKCLVSSTTTADRTQLVRWFFVAASLHPDVKDITNITPAQLETANRQLAELFMKLLTETCRDQASKALKFEGTSTIETSFNALGQVAGRELFSSPEVAAGLTGLNKYVDAEKIKALTR